MQTRGLTGRFPGSSQNSRDTRGPRSSWTSVFSALALWGEHYPSPVIFTSTPSFVSSNSRHFLSCVKCSESQPPSPATRLLRPPQRPSKAPTAWSDQAPQSLSPPHLDQIPAAKPLSHSSGWDIHLLSSPAQGGVMAWLAGTPAPGVGKVLRERGVGSELIQPSLHFAFLRPRFSQVMP